MVVGAFLPGLLSIAAYLELGMGWEEEDRYLAVAFFLGEGNVVERTWDECYFVWNRNYIIKHFDEGDGTDAKQGSRII